MERRVGPPTTGVPPLVGRQQVLRTFDASLDAAANGEFQFLGLVGEPGTGKTRLLSELGAAAEARNLPVLSGRAAEFEQLMPLGIVIDALDDRLETCAPELPDTIGTSATRLLATVFPSLSIALPDGPSLGDDHTGLARYRLYRTIRQLIDELAQPSGLVLILDDVHWADDTSTELLEHLVRHPPHGRTLIAVAYRPAQASSRLAALVETTAPASGDHSRQIFVEPLNLTEAEEFLGDKVNRTHARKLYEASGGNPFYLEALARMDLHPESISEGDKDGDLPRAVRAALQVELEGLSSAALHVAKAAAVAADEFEPGLAAAAGEISTDAALEALDELVRRDIVRPISAGRFRFRHPLVRHAVYGLAAAGWRLAAHARIADYLASVGAPATVRAHHVERAGRLGDERAINTLIDAARTVAPHAPAAAAHWLTAALRLMPEEPDPLGSAETSPSRPSRLELLMELAQAQAVSGRLAEGRETARTLLRLLPAGDHARRAKAARLCALMERLLGRSHEARTLLLAELRSMPDPKSAAAIPLRLRLVAERLFLGDIRAAQAVLDLMPEAADDWEPGLNIAIAALRPMPAYVSGRVTDAIGYAEAAARLMAAAPDDHLTEWLDAIAWLCWAEQMMGRYQTAQRWFTRAVAVARSAGQSYIMSSLLAGQARAYAMLGRLGEATAAAEEAAEAALLMGTTGQQLVMAFAQQSLIARLSGDDAAALAFADQAVRASHQRREWWESLALYAHGRALISLGRIDEGVEDLVAACDAPGSAMLDPGTLLACCESMAYVEAARGNADEALKWVDRANVAAHPDLEMTIGLTHLAHAQALHIADPASSADHALKAAETLEAAGLMIDAGRARLRAGVAFAEIGDPGKGRAELQTAADIFAGCGARTLHGSVIREQRRLGVRVHVATSRGTGPYGLSRRELEVATLVKEGYTNHQVAEKLFISDRTVETHLSRIFTKLGVTSRVAMVAALTRSVED
jgi:DNA-binding CsgD family transcriptional regulator/tetratricopeptide (TPR) repeat protein